MAQLQERLRELQGSEAERSRLITLLEGTPDLIGIADVNGFMIYMNKAGRQMVGLADDVDLKTINLRTSHEPEDLEKIIK